MAKLVLKEPILTAGGKNLKDTSALTVIEVQKLDTKGHEKLPNFTIGDGLIALINNKKNCKDLEEMGKMERLLRSIRTKMTTNKAEWQISKEELLDLENVFKTAPIADLNINIHGQIYNRIQDLLREASS